MKQITKQRVEEGVRLWQANWTNRDIMEFLGLSSAQTFAICHGTQFHNATPDQIYAVINQITDQMKSAEIIALIKGEAKNVEGSE